MSSSPSLAMFRTASIASLESCCSLARASVTACLRDLPAPKFLKSSDFTNLAFFVSYIKVSIVSTICLAGPSMSVRFTISAISLPAIPVSRNCLSSVPATKSPITTFLVVHVSTPSVTSLVSNNSFRYSDADISAAFLPCVIR